MNAIHARSQLRYSPTSIALEIRENPCETAIMLTRPSGDSQEKGTRQTQPSHVLAERAVEDSPRSTRAIKAGLGLPLKMRGEKRTSPHYSRRFLTKPPRRQARRARGAVRRGATPPGSSEGGAPPSWGFYKGAGPLVEVCEAGSRAEPATGGRHTRNSMLTDRAASPPAVRLVATAYRRLQ